MAAGDFHVGDSEAFEVVVLNNLSELLEVGLIFVEFGTADDHSSTS